MQKLIQYGHRLEDIKKYNLAQIELFLEAISHIEIEKYKCDTNSTRLAHADNKEFKKIMDKLDKINGVIDGK